MEEGSTEIIRQLPAKHTGFFVGIFIFATNEISSKEDSASF